MPVSRHVSWMAAVLVIATAGCSGSPQPAGSQGGATQGPGGTDVALAAEVTRFLDAWLVKRDAQAAIEGKASTAFADERFLPASALSPEEHKAQLAAPASAAADPVTPQKFQAAIQSQLSAKLEVDAAQAPQGAALSTPASLDALMVDFSPDAARQKEPDLWELIGGRTPRALAVAGVPSLAYPVREWRDISWSSSSTVGFRFALANIINTRRIDVQAVVTRLKPPDGQGDEVTILTLWSDEGSGGARWRLLGVERPPTS
jgi:hypothetical protein